jgi:hypothetical protein
MASSMRDGADKATWSQMAKRWLAYAEYYEDRRSAFGTRAETRPPKDAFTFGLRSPLAT